MVTVIFGSEVRWTYHGIMLPNWHDSILTAKYCHHYARSMNNQTPPIPTAVFAPPSHGMWELETTHHGLRPLSPFLRDTYIRGFEVGMTVLLKRWGLPLSGIRAELVNGCMYIRPTGVGEGAKPTPMPPKLIMKLMTRVHPEMRRRTRTAAQA